MVKDNIKKSDVEKIYEQLGISPNSSYSKKYPFFDSKKDEHLAWKPLAI